MKKWVIACALMADVVVCQSELLSVDTSQEKKEVSPPVVHGGRKTPLMDAIRRVFRDKAQGRSYSEREGSGHRRTENEGLSVLGEKLSDAHVQAPTAPSESEYLKEIASVLSIPVLKDDTPGDIAFKIKQCVGSAERYRGNVLSDESFEKAKSAIRIPADAETFKAYHIFIKKVAGKRIIVLDDNEQR